MTTGQKLAVGVAVVAVAAVAVVLVTRGNDATKDLKLEMRNGTCTITTPPDDKNVEVGKNKKITWHVQNLCTSDQLVLVGNFRPTPPDGGVLDCKAGIIESTWPFKKLDQSVRQVYVPSSETQDLVLKEAKNETGSTVTFYFDICMAGKKVDPRLDIGP
jgi:hypothetical protein